MAAAQIGSSGSSVNLPRAQLTGMDVTRALEHLNSNAQENSTGLCATYVRRAIEAGGLALRTQPRLAKDYGPTLIASNFVVVPTANYTATAGDIVVIQNYEGGNPAGHIAMYNGEKWVSDFVQRDMWGGPGYRRHQPAYVVYRP